MSKPKDHTKPRGGIGRNRNKQPSSHEEEIKMKNPTTPNKLDTRLHKGWNQLDAPWHAASVGTDKVKSGEHALPYPPKKAGRNARNQIDNASAVGLDWLSPVQDYNGGYQEKQTAKTK